MAPLVSRIDHVVVPVADPADLFAMLTQRLGLPPLWPVVDLGPFKSAGVAAGNCWIEIVADAESLTPLYAATLPAVFRGIAFASPMPCAQAGAALDRAGIPRDEVRAFSGRRPDGTDGPLVATLPVTGLVADAGIGYLCEMAHPVDPERLAARTARSATGPAAVGIRAVAEIQIGVRDVRAARESWTRLAEPGDDGAWRFGAGPGVRLKESPIDGISGIVARVDSLERATGALRDRGLLGPMRASGVGVNHAAAHGLDIWLIE